MAQRPPVVFKLGQGKDGNPAFSFYVRQHPTNYIWRADLERLTAPLVNMDLSYRRIWVNIYIIHPPGVPEDRLMQLGVIDEELREEG